MARRRRRRSRSGRRRGGSLLKKLGIGLLLLLPVAYFVFTRVFFDPFEEAQPPFQRLVPHDVDIYIRRERLDSDFGSFPAFAVLERLTASREFGEMAGTDWWKGLGWPDEIQATVDRIRAAVSGQDLVNPGELLGREVVLVGRLPVGPDAPPTEGADLAAGAYAALVRLTPTGKLGYATFLEAHDRIAPGAQLAAVADPDRPGLTYKRLDLPGQEPIFLARRRDLLVLGMDEQLVQDVLTSTESGRERSLGLSRLYTENMPEGPADPASGFDAEVMINLQRLLARAPAAGAATASEDAAADILPVIIDPTLGEQLVGRVAFDASGFLLRGRTSLESHRTAVERHGLVGTLPFKVGERLTAKFGLMPRDVSAVVSLNADLSDLLKTIRDGLDPELATLVDRALRGMAQYNPQLKLNGLEDMIYYLDRVLGKDITVAVRPLDHDVPEGSQPMPALAIIANVRDPDAWEALASAIIRGHRAFGVPEDGMFKQPEGGVGLRRWLEVPGTAIEAISWVVLDATSNSGTLVFGTDDDFVREIVAAYTGSRPSLASDPDVRDLIAGISEERANLVAWVSADAVSDVIAPYGPWLAAAETAVDLAAVRAAQRAAQLRLPAWRGKLGSDGELSAEDEAELDDLLDDLVRASEKERKAAALPAWTAAWQERFSWMALMKDGVLAIRMGERDASVALRVRSVLGR